MTILPFYELVARGHFAQALFQQCPFLDKLSALSSFKNEILRQTPQNALESTQKWYTSIHDLTGLAPTEKMELIRSIFETIHPQAEQDQIYSISTEIATDLLTKLSSFDEEAIRSLLAFGNDMHLALQIFLSPDTPPFTPQQYEALKEPMLQAIRDYNQKALHTFQISQLPRSMQFNIEYVWNHFLEHMSQYSFPKLAEVKRDLFAKIESQPKTNTIYIQQLASLYFQNYNVLQTKAIELTNLLTLKRFQEAAVLFATCTEDSVLSTMRQWMLEHPDQFEQFLKENAAYPSNDFWLKLWTLQIDQYQKAGKCIEEALSLTCRAPSTVDFENPLLLIRWLCRTLCTIKHFHPTDPQVSNITQHLQELMRSLLRDRSLDQIEVASCIQMTESCCKKYGIILDILQERQLADLLTFFRFEEFVEKGRITPYLSLRILNEWISNNISFLASDAASDQLFLAIFKEELLCCSALILLIQKEISSSSNISQSIQKVLQKHTSHLMHTDNVYTKATWLIRSLQIYLHFLSFPDERTIEDWILMHDIFIAIAQDDPLAQKLIKEGDAVFTLLQNKLSLQR